MEKDDSTDGKTQQERYTDETVQGDSGEVSCRASCEHFRLTPLLWWHSKALCGAYQSDLYSVYFMIP